MNRSTRTLRGLFLEVSLTPRVSHTSHVQKAVSLESEGDFTLKVRGIDREGKVQESPSLFGRLLGRTFPDGAKGIHSVNVTVKGQ